MRTVYLDPKFFAKKDGDLIIPKSHHCQSQLTPYGTVTFIHTLR